MYRQVYTFTVQDAATPSAGERLGIHTFHRTPLLAFLNLSLSSGGCFYKELSNFTLLNANGLRGCLRCSSGPAQACHLTLVPLFGPRSGPSLQSSVTLAAVKYWHFFTNCTFNLGFSSTKAPQRTSCCHSSVVFSGRERCSEASNTLTWRSASVVSVTSHSELEKSHTVIVWSESRSSSGSRSVRHLYAWFFIILL